MKKAMLYGSIVMTVIYAVALFIVIAFQKMFQSAYGGSESLPFVLPMTDIVIKGIGILVVLGMAVLLLKFSERGEVQGEIPVIVINILWLTCGNWVAMVINMMNNMRYARLSGADTLASYSVLHMLMNSCGPLLIFAQLLLLLYAGISLGRKEYEKSNR